MKEEANKIIKRILNKILILTLPILIVVIIIVAGGVYILTIIDGDWNSNNNTPQNYKKNTTFTENGFVANYEAILEEALKNIGYSNEDIAKITEDLQKEGYSGVSLDNKVLERKLEILGVDKNTSNVMELIWELNKELYIKYDVDDYKKLEYLMNAELVTKAPYIESLLPTNNINGRIFFDRYIDGKTQPIRLKYINEQSFNKLVENNDSNILNFFTMTDSNEVKIAYYEIEEVSVTTNDSTVDVNTYDSRVTNDAPTFSSKKFKTKNVPYTTMVPEKYSMPFEYLWAFLVMSEDYDFVKSLADLAYNSEIVISIYDNILENTIETEYTYDTYEQEYSQVKKKKTEEITELDQQSLWQLYREGYTPVGSTDEQTKDLGTVDSEYPKKIVSTGDPTSYSVKKKIYTYANTIEMKVTYANVWIAEYKTEYNNYSDGHKYTSGIPDSTQNTEIGEDSQKEKENSRNTDVELEIKETVNNERDVELDFKSILNDSIVKKKVKEKVTERVTYIGDTWTTIWNSKQNIKEDTYLYSSTYVNNPDATTIREKTKIYGEFDTKGHQIGENFCSLFKDLPTKQYIIENREWLMDILEENPETADMIDLTKYLLNIAAQKKYYELDGFSFEEIFNTTKIGILYGGSTEEKLWFALLDAGYSKIAAAGVLGNIYAESGIRSDNLENSKESIIGMTDSEYTEAVNNGTYTKFIEDKAGYGLAQWTSSGRKEGLYLFAQSKGTTIDDVDMQIEYLLGEISQTGGANGFATFQMGIDKQGYNYLSWKDATTIEEAAMAFCYVFERPKGTEHQDREVYAKMYYDRYKDLTELSSSIGDISLTGDSLAKMQEMLQEAIRIANDNRYGYSQDKRNDEFYYDCSSLVARLYRKYFGIDMPSTTAQYPSYTNCYIGNPATVKLQPGDVLWRRSGEQGHVTLYIGNGNFVAAHTDTVPKPNQITVYQDRPSAYMRVYRFIK